MIFALERIGKTVEKGENAGNNTIKSSPAVVLNTKIMPING